MILPSVVGRLGVRVDGGITMVMIAVASSIGRGRGCLTLLHNLKVCCQLLIANNFLERDRSKTNSSFLYRTHQSCYRNTNVHTLTCTCLWGDGVGVAVAGIRIGPL